MWFLAIYLDSNIEIVEAFVANKISSWPRDDLVGHNRKCFYAFLKGL